jgi:hypothetical protein
MARAVTVPEGVEGLRVCGLRPCGIQDGHSSHLSNQVLLNFGKRHTDSPSRSAKMERTCLASRLPLLRLSDDSEQEVLRLDLAGSRACRLNSRKANNHPSSRREGDFPARARPRFALQLVGEDLPADSERFQCASGHLFTQGIEAEH